MMYHKQCNPDSASDKSKLFLCPVRRDPSFQQVKHQFMLTRFLWPTCYCDSPGGSIKGSVCVCLYVYVYVYWGCMCKWRGWGGGGGLGREIQPGRLLILCLRMPLLFITIFLRKCSVWFIMPFLKIFEFFVSFIAALQQFVVLLS